jgi:glycosyltransferase involved in cell wall biosynthesis
MNNSIKVISPFYNPGEFIDNCVGSLLSQKYDNYQVIFINDASTDGSEKKIPSNDIINLVNNTERKTALENIHNAIMNMCDPEDIIVLVDGDDWLPNKKVISYINDFYNQNDCWVMYGNSIWTNGVKGCAFEYSQEEFLNLRKSQFNVSHIRTFRAGLYHKIAEQDPIFSCLKDITGTFYKMTYDVAIMFPIMEMAGYNKVKFNDTNLYIYNRSNPISDDRVNQALQTAIHVEISNKPVFKQISDYL